MVRPQLDYCAHFSSIPLLQPPVCGRNGETAEDPADSSHSSRVQTIWSTQRGGWCWPWLEQPKEGWEVSAWNLFLFEKWLQGQWGQVELSNTRQCNKGPWPNCGWQASGDIRKKHFPRKTNAFLEHGVWTGSYISIFGGFQNSEWTKQWFGVDSSTTSRKLD